MQTSHSCQLHSVTYRGLEEKERRKVHVGLTYPSLCLCQRHLQWENLTVISTYIKSAFFFFSFFHRSGSSISACSVLHSRSSERVHFRFLPQTRQLSPDQMAAPCLAPRTSESIPPVWSSRVAPYSRQIREKDAFKSTVNSSCSASRCTLWILKCLSMKRNKEMYSPFPRLHR